MTKEQEQEHLKSELVNVMRRMRSVKLNVLSGNVIYTEYVALDQINRYMQTHPDSRGIYVSELAGVMRIAPSAASRLLNTLESKGLITREINKKDRRNTYVGLTSIGKEAMEHSSSNMNQLKERIISRMGHEDISKLIDLWNQLAGIMEEEAAVLEKQQKIKMEEDQ